MKYEDFFNENGNFIYGRYDPYRVSDEFEEYHNSIFDERSNVRDEVYVALRTWLKSRSNLCYFSDIVTLVHVQNHGLGTKGSYPATYMWR